MYICKIKKSPTKREREMASNALKERKTILRVLNSEELRVNAKLIMFALKLDVHSNIVFDGKNTCYFIN